MFGDIGHGGALFLFALFLCLKREEIQKGGSFLSMILIVRWLLLFMGFFAMYAGFIYNDFLSIPWNLFGSCYENHETPHGPVAKKIDDCVYPFGLDPKWYIASNELTFFNSLKMKLSVVIGVSHMLLGIFLKSLNCIHFSNYMDLLFEFVPQILFMCCTFGYMVVCIFVKWATPWNLDPTSSGPHPPSIISVFIDFVLKAGDASEN